MLHYGAAMAARFTYSRWDGTQQLPDLDAEAVMEQLTDDLLQHGDVGAALRRLLNQGMDMPDGSRVAGLEELRERMRQRREELEAAGEPDGRLAEVAAELADIIDEERHGIDNDLLAARASGDERRLENATSAATQRHAHLDLLPDDPAGQIASLSEYDFTSSEAQQRFDELTDRLREQMLSDMIDRVTEAAEATTADDVARMTEMLAALNEMIERRDRGEDPGFEDFMDSYGDMFDGDPSNLDELLEQIARRMAAAEAMYNSMSAEQQAQMQQLAQRFGADPALQQQMDRLSGALRQQFGSMNWDSSYDMNGSPLSPSEGIPVMAELGRLDELEQMLSGVVSPADLAEVDPDRVRDLLGPDAADALETLSRLTEELVQAGLVDRSEGRLELTPRGLRAIGSNALRELFSSLRDDHTGQHETFRIGTGHERTFDTKPYEYGDPFQLDLQRTIRNAIGRSGPGTPVSLSADDFEVERNEHLTRASTVLMVDLSMSMPMRGNFLPAKKVAMALHTLITTRYPHDFIGLVGFSETARTITAAQLPEVSWDYVYGTNMHHGFTLARRMLANQQGTKQIIMITDGEPTAHITPSGGVYFDYPPAPATIEATLREVVRCTREDIRINTFVLDATASLAAFVERMVELNGGRAFYTSNDELGGYVLVDFVERRRRVSRLSRTG